MQYFMMNYVFLLLLHRAFGCPAASLTEFKFSHQSRRVITVNTDFFFNLKHMQKKRIIFIPAVRQPQPTGTGSLYIPCEAKLRAKKRL